MFGNASIYEEMIGMCTVPDFTRLCSPESLSVSALRNGKGLAYPKVGNEAHGPTPEEVGTYHMTFIADI